MPLLQRNDLDPICLYIRDENRTINGVYQIPYMISLTQAENNSPYTNRQTDSTRTPNK